MRLWLANLLVIIPFLAGQRANAQQDPVWAGTDNFSSGISSANWTLYPNNNGEVRALGTNGHASFLVPSVFTGKDKSVAIVWRGNPTPAEDWTVEVRGHNSATPSQLQLGAARTDSVGTSSQEAFVVSRRQRTGGGFGVSLWQGGGYTNRAFVSATNPDFGLRLAYRSSSGEIQAWYDPGTSGTGWTMLDTISLRQVSPTMTLSHTFTFFVNAVADHDYGPITEGQLWADDFSLRGVSEPLRFAGDVAVSNGLCGLRLAGPANARVILQGSPNLTEWTPIATNTLPAGGLPLNVPTVTGGRQFFRALLAP